MDYFERLKDPRWQKTRLTVLDRDEWACRICGESKTMLSVHHTYYAHKKEPWDYPLASLITLCKACHENEKTNRPTAEKKLLTALKKKQFSSADILEIAEGINKMNIYNSPEVSSSIICWLLKTPYVFRKIGDAFFKSLSPKEGKNEVV